MIRISSRYALQGAKSRRSPGHSAETCDTLGANGCPLRKLPVHERQRRAVADELNSPASVTRSATLTFEALLVIALGGTTRV
jgi:hypothetical protein